MPVKRPPSPKDTIKVRSRFKVGQTVLVRAKITAIRESFDKNDPELVLDPKGLIVHTPIRVHERNLVPAPDDET